MNEPRRLPWATIVFALANVAVFGWELSQGAHPMNPTAMWMGEHGGNFGPLTFDGEPWRLLTSMFLHYGVLHIVMNMVGLIDGGRHVERMYGPAGFVVLYLLSGLVGSYVSALRGHAMSAGASGAIFGVFGAFGAFLLVHRNRLDKEEVKKQSRGLVIFLAYNIFFGVTSQGIDMLAHAGGLVGGFVVGLALEVGTDHSHSTLRRSLVVFVLGLGVVAGGVMLAPRPNHALEAFVVTEARVVPRWNAVADQAQAARISDPLLADVIEDELLPQWRAARVAYERDAGNDARRPKMLGYIKAREEGWEIILVGLRTSDIEKVKQGMARFREAEGFLK